MAPSVQTGSIGDETSTCQTVDVTRPKQGADAAFQDVSHIFLGEC